MNVKEVSSPIKSSRSVVYGIEGVLVPVQSICTERKTITEYVSKITQHYFR